MAQIQTRTKGEARLSAQLEVATELFLKQGYETVSIDEIITRAGGSRRNIYDSFGGKEGLFQSAITKLCDELTDPIGGIIDKSGGWRKIFVA